MTIEAQSNVFESGVLELSCFRTSWDAYSFLKTYSDSDGANDVEHDLNGDGSAYADGSWTGGGADYADYFEWEDGNPSNEDRRGLTVVSVEDKIRPAKTGETPIGVVSKLGVVVGNSGWNRWTDKYLKDDYGSYVTVLVTCIQWEGENGEVNYCKLDQKPEDISISDKDVATYSQEERVLNPEYDPDKEYIARSHRKEWDPVGLVGRVRIKKNQPTAQNWIKLKDISDEVEEWLIR
jgi:hypothetical protein